MEVPTFETERLRMRGHRIGDFEDCAGMWADPLVVRYIGGRPFSTEESWSRLLRYAGHWSLLGFGYWAVEERATGEFVGELGFADFHREIEPSIKELPELGWVLVSRVHGKGYATEAVRAVTAWGDAYLKSNRTVCLIHPENLASVRVAEKCGYQEFQRTTYKSHTTVVFARQAIPQARG